MSKSNQSEPKKVKISFRPSDVFCDGEEAVIYGIKVKLEGKKLVGYCDESVFKSLSDAGKCE